MKNIYKQSSKKKNIFYSLKKKFTWTNVGTDIKSRNGSHEKFVYESDLYSRTMEFHGRNWENVTSLSKKETKRREREEKKNRFKLDWRPTCSI